MLRQIRDGLILEERTSLPIKMLSWLTTLAVGLVLFPLTFPLALIVLMIWSVWKLFTK